MVYMLSPSWHFLYALKSQLNYANEGFDGGFITNSCFCVWNYIHEGKYYDDGGGKGAVVNAPWDGGEMNPNPWSFVD